MGLRSWLKERRLKRLQKQMEEEIITAVMEASKRERVKARHRRVYPPAPPRKQAVEQRKEPPREEVDNGTSFGMLGQMLSVPAVSYNTETTKTESFTTPDPTPAYDGFSGGESGGAGASGSWDSGSSSSVDSGSTGSDSGNNNY